MRISKIRLQNWKNFKEASAPLARRAFIIGPNASGKSNFLDAFRFLRDVAGDGLRQAVETRGGVSSIRCLAARESPSVALEVTLSDSDGQEAWRYELEFNSSGQFRKEGVRQPEVRRERVFDLKSEEQVVDRPNKDDREDAMLLTQTALEQIAANRDFREVADFFGSISYQHIIPQVVRDPQGFSPKPVENDPFGRDFLQRLWNTRKRTRDARLKRISKALGEAVPQLNDLEVEMDMQGTPHLVGRFEHWRPHDARQDEWQFSDGTLRLFGLMWAVFEGRGPLLLEEPELSVHTEVVRHLPQLFEQLQEEIRRMKRKADYEARQLIISTHSSELLSDRGIGANEAFRIEPSAEGSVIKLPDKEDRAMLRSGLSMADVLLPKSKPSGKQLAFDLQ